MRSPPNALNVFRTTGATGTARTAPATALAEPNRNRLARGTAPAAARPSAKNLRVESSRIKVRHSRRFRIGVECGVWPALCGHKHGSNLLIPGGLIKPSCQKFLSDPLAMSGLGH